MGNLPPCAMTDRPYFPLNLTFESINNMPLLTAEQENGPFGDMSSEKKYAWRLEQLSIKINGVYFKALVDKLVSGEDYNDTAKEIWKLIFPNDNIDSVCEESKIDFAHSVMWISFNHNGKKFITFEKKFGLFYINLINWDDEKERSRVLEILNRVLKPLLDTFNSTIEDKTIIDKLIEKYKYDGMTSSDKNKLRNFLYDQFCECIDSYGNERFVQSVTNCFLNIFPNDEDFSSSNIKLICEETMKVVNSKNEKVLS